MFLCGSASLFFLGGILGLFTGMSILSLVELLHWTLLMLGSFYQEFFAVKRGERRVRYLEKVKRVREWPEM